MNANANQGGTNNGPTVQDNEGVRINFVSGIAGSPQSGGDGYDAPADDHTFNSHESVNGALVSFFTKNGAAATIRFTAFLDTSPLNTVKATQVVEAITSVLVTVGGVNYFFDADGTQGSITVDFDPLNGAGSVEISGICDEDSVAVFANNNFNAVEVVHAGGDDFALGGYGGAVPGEEKFISLDAFDLALTDSDGSVATIPDGLSIELEPEGVTVLDAGRDESGGALLGTAGDDVLVFELADAGAPGSESAYTVGDGDNLGVANFGQSGDDVLDLRDLLQGETSGTLTDYLNITSDGTDTLVEISSVGFASGYDAGEVDTTITLLGVDLGSDTAAAIALLQAANQIITD